MSSDHIWPILFFVSLAGNLILLFYRPLLRLLRRGEEVSEDEIMAMVEEGEESGAIERNEKELIENVFEFNNTTAEDVMIHRTDMVTLSLDDDEETILSAIRESGLSRFPVYQGNVDDIVGILSTRQYLLNFHVERPQELRRCCARPTSCRRRCGLTCSSVTCRAKRSTWPWWWMSMAGPADW